MISDKAQEESMSYFLRGTIPQITLGFIGMIGAGM